MQDQKLAKDFIVIRHGERTDEAANLEKCPENLDAQLTDRGL